MQEIELKFAIPADRVDEVEKQPLLASCSDVSEKELVNIYMDTPDHLLRQQGVGFRLRRKGRQWLQTVKAESGGGGGLFSRKEYEAPIAGDTPDFPALQASAFGTIFRDETLCKQLVPVFSTNFHRKAWQLRDDRGNHAEVVLDRGEVRAGDHREPICEMELELIQGEPSTLLSFARELAQTLPFQLEYRSKAHRGYDLLQGGCAAYTKGSVPAFSPYRLPFLAKAFSTCFQHLVENVPVALEQRHVEGVHQMRVAVRRLRATHFLFAKKDRIFGGLAKELRWLGRILNGARDWDVFVAETLAPLQASFPQTPALPALVQAAKQQERQADAQVVDVLQQARFRLLMLDLLAFQATLFGEASCLGVDHQEIVDFTPLQQTWKWVIRHGADFDRLTAPQRHRLRIKLKRLRYGAELCSDFKPKRAQPFLSLLKELQDILGIMNDAAVAHKLLQDLDADRFSPAGAALVRGWFAGRKAHLAQEYHLVWARFSTIKPFWK